MLRDMSSLDISLTYEDINFSSISSLTQLTSLELSAYPAGIYPSQTVISMRMLPLSLKKLTLYHVELRHTDEVSLPYLTRLELIPAGKRDDNLTLLTKLLDLKVCPTVICCL